MKPKLVLFLLLIHSFIFGQVNFNQGSINLKEYYEVIPYQTEIGKIIIPVSINDKTYRFLLDTGAPNLFSPELLKELKINEGDSINVSDANDQGQKMKFVVVPQVKIGNLVFENQAGLIYDLEKHYLLSCYKIDGFIGSNLLRNSIIKINGTNKTIVITNKIKSLNIEKKPIKMKLFGNQKSPYVELKFVGKNSEKASDMVLVDTGMDGFYDMSKRAYMIFEKNNIFDALSSAVGIGDAGLFGVGNSSEQKLLEIENANLNQQIIKNIMVTTTTDNNSRIGLDILKYGDVTLDFLNKKFYFESTKTIDVKEKTPKFYSSVQNNKVVVGLIWDEKLKMLMNTGDEVISIDEIDISNISLCDFLKLKKEWKNKDRYILKTKNKEGQINEINIEN
ncbi:MAG: retropepsin-like aspartic protease [Flavobacterium sp.]